MIVIALCDDTELLFVGTRGDLGEMFFGIVNEENDADVIELGARMQMRAYYYDVPMCDVDDFVMAFQPSELASYVAFETRKRQLFDHGIIHTTVDTIEWNAVA